MGARSLETSSRGAVRSAGGGPSPPCSGRGWAGMWVPYPAGATGAAGPAGGASPGGGGPAGTPMIGPEPEEYVGERAALVAWLGTAWAARKRAASSGVNSGEPDCSGAARRPRVGAAYDPDVSAGYDPDT